MSLSVSSEGETVTLQVLNNGDHEQSVCCPLVLRIVQYNQYLKALRNFGDLWANHLHIIE